MVAHGSSRRRTRWLWLLTAFVLAMAVLTPVTAPTQSASAANAGDWDPGFIIDDAVFYNSSAMTAPQIQTFLNSKLARCSSGYTCLKDYTQNTDNRPADRYCNGYTGAPSESAATIIDKVARSCGVSQQVLLVLLEKEQSLVTYSAPEPRRFSAAMGQGCPDTAPCDPATAGFFYQVYYAARQFEVYRLNPTLFGYIAQRWNNILLHPDGSRNCGTQRVFIQNQATAGLYIYTPYVPNAAALNNLYGTGDSCSSYGNRNFWRIFTDWFGNTRTFEVHPGFVAPYEAAGGANGYMGRPTGNAVFVDANGQGWYQPFTGGTIYGSYYGGTQWVANNIILAEYNRQGGAYSSMGWPTSGQICVTGLRCWQSFLTATISTTEAYGAHVIWGGIDQYWRTTGGANGSLGSALNDVAYRQTAAGAAWVQNFERGVFVEGNAGRFLVPYSSVLDAWVALGGGDGWLGWPRSDYGCVATGCVQSFGGGVLTASGFGTHIISGGFVGPWEKSGGLNGYGPAYNELARTDVNGGGWTQNFAAGIIAQSGSGLFFVPYGPGQAAWSASGAERGKTYGWPQSARTCDDIGCVQVFQGGSISESAYGTFGTFGGLGGYWLTNGGLGAFGAALNNIRYSSLNNGGWAQHFGRGVITQQSSGTPLFSPYGPILNTWYQNGAESSSWGWPTAAPTCDATQCTQQFQNGVATAVGSTVTFAAR